MSSDQETDGTVTPDRHGVWLIAAYVVALFAAHALLAWTSLIVGTAMVLALTMTALAHAARLDDRPSIRGKISNEAASMRTEGSRAVTHGRDAANAETDVDRLGGQISLLEQRLDRLERDWDRIESLRRAAPLAAFLRCYALVALVGVMPYLLPLGDIPATLIPAVLALPGVFGIITLRRVLDGGVIVRRVGRSWPREAAFALVGIPLGVLGRAIGLSTDPHLLPTTVVATFGLFTVAMVEELAVRGYLQSALGPILGVVPAMGVVAIVGAAPAVADPAAFLLAVVAGIAFGWWISRGNGVLGAGFAHGVALVLISLWPAIAR